MNEVESTAVEKALVCGTAFFCACAAFGLSVLMLIPATARLLQMVGAPDFVQLSMIFLLLIAFPVVGAIWGIEVGDRLLERQRAK